MENIFCACDYEFFSAKSILDEMFEKTRSDTESLKDFMNRRFNGYIDRLEKEANDRMFEAENRRLFWHLPHRRSNWCVYNEEDLEYYERPK